MKKNTSRDEFHFLFECNGLEKLRISVIPTYYRTRCNTLKHSIIKCKLDISENINTADLNYQSVYPEKLNSIGEILDPVSYFGRTRKVVPRLRTSTPVTHIEY